MQNNQLKKLSGSAGCFICDNNASNARSLHLEIFWDEGAEAIQIAFSPDETWCGYGNVVHGGLVASVLDEAMAWVVKQKSGEWAMTVDLQVRYKFALEPGKAYLARAKVENLGRVITTSAQLLTLDGQVAAQAFAKFLPAKGKAKPRNESTAE